MVHASSKTGPAERFDKKEKANMYCILKTVTLVGFYYKEPSKMKDV